MKARSPKRFHASISAALALGSVAALLHGCATPPAPAPDPVAPAPRAPAAAEARQPGRLLARDDEFAIVVTGADDNLGSLARRYLGDTARGWWIGEYNGIAEVKPGQTVVIPLKPHNRVGVYADGFQTVPILCYHRFGSRASKLTVTPAAFTAQMEYLQKNGYNVLPLARLDEFLAGKAPLPRKSVIVTIDDGYKSTFEIAYPILRKHGFPATVFLYSDFVGAGDALTFAQMKEMMASGLIEIQPHSKTHANLTLRQPGESDGKYRERMQREVEGPVAVIQDKLAIASHAYAYPYGDVNDTVVDLLAHKGMRLGLTVTPGGNGFFAYPYMLRRNMVFGNEDLEAFKTKLNTFARIAAR
jgi:peptidoglycan/xylan/chitin deacetylase (PgdA/CDA1 family)